MAMTPERKQALAVMTIVIVTFGAIVLAFLAGRGQDTLTAAAGAAKPLSTDKPRDITMPIARSENSTAPDFTAEELAEASGPAKETTILLRDKRLRDAVLESVKNRLAQEALTQSDPAQGVSMLVVQLDTLETASEAAEVYSALGTLYLQLDPPALEQAADSLREVQHFTEDPHAAQEALLEEVRILQSKNGWEQAGPRLREAYLELPEATVTGMQLAILFGKCQEESGDVSGAEQTYTRTMERILSAKDTLGKEADPIYRQACLNLVRLYRGSGKEDAAESVLRAMRAQLGSESPALR
ncbi:MAG: hypothetical protein IT364_04120 [Candidatus Hydrogenedentes bacterium]|nr:hypothetical protein [Candidatus Hydrogenedentota bacterium]